MASDPRLLPEGIRDASNRSLAELIDRLGGIDLAPLLVYLVDQVEASALPHLIEQFHVTGSEGGLSATTTDARRALVKRAIDLHRRKGTLSAVHDALSTVGLPVRVVEWWEVGGTPHTYSVAAIVPDGGLDLRRLGEIGEMTLSYAPARAHLTTRSAEAERSGPLVMSGIALSGQTVTLYPREV